MKKCSTSVIRQMQIKNTKRYNSVPIRMTKIKKTDTPNVGKNVEQPKLSYISSGNVKWFDHSGKRLVSFL